MPGVLRTLEMLRGQRITKAGLESIGKGKYSSSAPTLLDKVCYAIWWNPVAACLPARLAPNAITLAGWLAVALAQSLLLWVSPDFKHRVPCWTNVAVATLWLFYMTCDAVDGMQARKTGAMSPLGQVLDHICDSLAILVGPLSCCAAAGFGLGLETYGVLFLTTTPWFISQWTAYFTHISDVAGATEGEMIVVAFHLVTAWLGGDVWRVQVKLPGMDGEVEAVLLVIVFGSVIAAAVSCVSIYNVLAVLHTPEEVSEAVRLVLPYLILVLFALLWATTLPGRLAHLLLFVVCCTFTRTVAELILGEVTRQGLAAPYRTERSLLALLPVFLLTGWSGVLGEPYFDCIFGAYTVLCFLDAWFFVWDALKQIVEDRNISVFAVKPRD